MSVEVRKNSYGQIIHCRLGVLKQVNSHRTQYNTMTTSDPVTYLSSSGMRCHLVIVVRMSSIWCKATDCRGVILTQSTFFIATSRLPSKYTLVKESKKRWTVPVCFKVFSEYFRTVTTRTQSTRTDENKIDNCEKDSWHGT